MNLHEYQGKELLKSYGVAIQEGLVANTLDEAVDAYGKIKEKTGSGFDRSSDPFTAVERVTNAKI